MTTDISPASAVAAASSCLQGGVLYGRSSEQVRRICNGAVKHLPALIVRPESPAEVQVAVLAARRHDLPLSVRGGGHDCAERSLRHGGQVIDLSRMGRVIVDPELGVATVPGGVTAGDVVVAAQPHGLSAATGTSGGAGMAGLTLGGGYPDDIFSTIPLPASPTQGA